jgi:hypothetical protein
VAKIIVYPIKVNEEEDSIKEERGQLKITIKELEDLPRS